MSELNPIRDIDRHIIAPGTEVLDGVFLARAGVVVDVHENPGSYEVVLGDVYDRLLRCLEFNDRELNMMDKMQAVHLAANKYAPYNASGYQEVLKTEAAKKGRLRVSTDNHIGLSTFITEQGPPIIRPIGGICHEHTLLSGAMLRLMQERGDLEEGNVSVWRSSEGADEHTTLEFICDGSVYRIDNNVGAFQLV